MQPPFFGSQTGVALEHALSSGLLLHVPLLHTSLVHAIPSLQSLSAQQALQPLPSKQHLPPPMQEGNEHFPDTQAPVWQALWGVQSASLTHSAVFTHAFAVASQVDPSAQDSVCAQVP
jgi:hypothetical protein